MGRVVTACRPAGASGPSANCPARGRTGGGRPVQGQRCTSAPWPRSSRGREDHRRARRLGHSPPRGGGGRTCRPRTQRAPCSVSGGPASPSRLLCASRHCPHFADGVAEALRGFLGGSVSPQKLHDVLTLEPRDGQTPEELVGLRRGLLDGPASRLTTVLAGRRRGQTPEGVCAAGRPGEEAATGGRLQAEERARRSRVQPAARPPGRGGDPACSVSHQPLVQPALRHRRGRPGCSGQRWRWPPTRHGSLHGCSPGPGPPEAPARKRGPAW